MSLLETIVAVVNVTARAAPVIERGCERRIMRSALVATFGLFAGDEVVVSTAIHALLKYY